MLHNLEMDYPLLSFYYPMCFFNPLRAFINQLRVIRSNYFFFALTVPCSSDLTIPIS